MVERSEATRDFHQPEIFLAKPMLYRWISSEGGSPFHEPGLYCLVKIRCDCRIFHSGDSKTSEEF